MSDKQIREGRVDKTDVQRIAAASGVPTEQVYDVLWAVADLGYALQKPTAAPAASKRAESDRSELRAAAHDSSDETITVSIVTGDLPGIVVEVDTGDVFHNPDGSLTCELNVEQMTAVCDAWASASPARSWTLTGVIYTTSLTAVLLEANPAGVTTSNWAESFPGEFFAGLFQTSTFPFQLAVSAVARRA